MNLTVYFGTFNPIHSGHVLIAEKARELLNADKVLFVPAFNPPHRENSVLDAKFRYEMVKIALQDKTFFEVSDIEFNLGGKSYSYNTIKKLYEIYKISGKINFIIGTDAIKHFDSWHKAQELADLIRFIIIRRPQDEDVEHILSNLKVEIKEYKILNIPLIDISSSMIRNNIKNNKPIINLVDEKVEKYIFENGFYR